MRNLGNEPGFCVDFGFEALDDGRRFGVEVGAADGQRNAKFGNAALDFFKCAARA